MGYESYQIPSYGGLLEGYTPEQQELLGAGSGADIASALGYDPEKYGQYFQPIQTEQLQKGLAELPNLRDFLYGKQRAKYGMQKQSLMGEIGRTGLVSVAPGLKTKGAGLLEDFTSGLYGVDKQIQGMVSDYQSALTGGMTGIYGTMGSLLGAGVEPTLYDGGIRNRWGNRAATEDRTVYRDPRVGADYSAYQDMYSEEEDI